MIGWLAVGVVTGTVAVLLVEGSWRVLGSRLHPSTAALAYGVALAKFVVPVGLVVSGAASHGGDGFLGPAAPSTAGWSASALVTTAWALGAGASALARVVAATRAARARRDLPDAPPDVAAPVRQLAASVGSPVPRVVVDPAGPYVAGLVRPVLALPGPVSEAVLLHELAHLRRRDPWWAALASAVESAFFFWPVVRFAGRRFALAREMACDRAVLDAGVPPATYADLLLDHATVVAGLALATPPLERRIAMLFSPPSPRRTAPVVALALVVGLAPASSSGSAVVPPLRPTASAPSLAEGSTVTGAVDPEEVRGTLLEHLDEVSPCVSGLQGALELHFTFDAAGTVTDVCQGFGSTLPEDAGRCVSARLSGWTFPWTRDGGGASVEARLTFGPDHG